MIKQILQFIQNHWLLCSTGAVVAALIGFEEIKNRITGLPKMSTLDATIALNREKATAIDLRNPTSFAAGHILGAINISHNDLEQHLKKLEPYKNQILILVDDNDTHVSSTGSKLQKMGFSKVYGLIGGLAAWKEAQLPLNKS